MKYALPVLLAAVIAAATPALADHDHGRGGGGWHGGGGEQRGNGNGYGRGGRWGGREGPPGQVGRGGPGEGRWGGYPAGPEPGPGYAEPPRARAPQEYYRGEQDEARNGVRSGAMMRMGDILRRLERSHGGKMLDANLGQGPNGQPVYRVIWASPDGRRVDYIIDARTGAILQGY
jgi:hypothetical protein